MNVEKKYVTVFIVRLKRFGNEYRLVRSRYGLFIVGEEFKWVEKKFNLPPEVESHLFYIINNFPPSLEMVVYVEKLQYIQFELLKGNHRCMPRDFLTKKK